MKTRSQSCHRILRRKLISLAVASCFASGVAEANPTNPVVVSGTAAIQQSGNLLSITNSPNAIINWGSFSIGASEITRFIQQSQASAVLNRVVGQDPSAILGALQSNGRVFLINPNGIVFGAGSQIDVAGLVASTLNLSDADFLAGRLRFTETLNAGSVVNQGSITTGAGGNVYLVAPDITNSGIITSPKGEVILAAGRSVELVDPGTPNLRVEISAPDTQARNLGQIVAEAGRVGIYAGLINHSGTIQANSAVVGERGEIVLKATQNATLEAGSVTTANGAEGGKITIQSGDTTLVSGTVEARGTQGAGGTVQILGNLVGLTGSAAVDASGETGGGAVLVGGDYQGKNPDIQNAYRTYFGPEASIKADAITSGDGGRVIVWADDATRAYGSISARGGNTSGNGGFVETSGHYLEVTRAPDVSAPFGQGGTWLLDPFDIEIVAGSGVTNNDGAPTFTPNAATSKVGADLISAQLNANANVTINTAGGGTESGNITVSSAISAAPTGSPVLTLQADANILLNASITNSGAGEVHLIANGDITQALAAPITTGKLLAEGEHISLEAVNMVSEIAGVAGTCCNSFFRLKNGQSLVIGTVGATSGVSASDTDGGSTISIEVTSGSLTVNQSVTASNPGSGAAVTLSAAGNVTLNSNVTANGSTPTVIITSTGGGITVDNSAAITASGTAGNASITFTANNGITVGSGSSMLASMTGSVDSAAVNMTTTNGDIALGGNISAINPFSTATIDLNANNGAILGQGGILDAATTIDMNATSGIGQPNNPVRIFNGNPDVTVMNSTSGDVVLSQVNGNVISSAFDITNNAAGRLVDLTAENGSVSVDTAFSNPNGALTLRANGAGNDILLNAAVSAAAGVLTSLIANDTISQTSLGIITGGLSVSANGDVILSEANAINYLTTGTTLGGQLQVTTGAPVSLETIATGGGNITIQSSGSISLGAAGSGINASTGNVTLTSTGGAIVDNHAGTDIIASAATLAAATGIASVAAPLQTQLSSLTAGSSGGEIGILNTGNLAFGISSFGGSNIKVQTSGALTTSGAAFNASGSVSLLGSGINIGQGLTAAGNLLLDAGAGNLAISGVSVEGFNVTLNGANIDIGNATASAATSVLANNAATLTTAGNLTLQGGAGTGASAAVDSIASNTSVTTGGDVRVRGGSGPNAYASLVGGPDLFMTVGGAVRMDAGSSASEYARIASTSPNSIHILFPNLALGGYFVNGVEYTVYDILSTSGFMAGGLPAIFGNNLLITYGLSAPSSLLPPVITTTNNPIDLTLQGGYPIDPVLSDGEGLTARGEETEISTGREYIGIWGVVDGATKEMICR